MWPAVKDEATKLFPQEVPKPWHPKPPSLEEKSRLADKGVLPTTQQQGSVLSSYRQFDFGGYQNEEGSFCSPLAGVKAPGALFLSLSFL
jgi:hypothetical protein